MDVGRVLAETKRWSAVGTEAQYKIQCIHMIQNRARAMRRGKWAVSWDTYPAEYYPKVCTGAGYVMSRDALAKLLRVAQTTTRFPIDDVYITGILRAKTDIPLTPPGIFRAGHPTISVNHVIKP